MATTATTTPTTVPTNVPRPPSSLRRFFQNARLRDILPPRPILTTPDQAPLSAILQALNSTNLRCIVVMKAETPPRAIALIDGYDVAMTALEATAWTESLNRETVANLLRDARYFASRTAEHVTRTSSHEPLTVLTTDSSIYEAIELLSGGIHRALVLENGQIVNILSQSDILKTIIIRHDLWGEKKDVVLEFTGLITNNVEKVKEFTSVINCLRHMRNKDVSGVAVVDDNGVITHNFSSSDLLQINEENFHLLSLPVRDFLFKLHGFTKPPVVCRRDDKIENLLMKFFTYGVHRVYVVDSTNRPTGIVTLTDLMGFLLTA